MNFETYLRDQEPVTGPDMKVDTFNDWLEDLSKYELEAHVIGYAASLNDDQEQAVRVGRAVVWLEENCPDLFNDEDKADQEQMDKVDNSYSEHKDTQ